MNTNNQYFATIRDDPHAANRKLKRNNNKTWPQKQIFQKYKNLPEIWFHQKIPRKRCPELVHRLHLAEFSLAFLAKQWEFNAWADDRPRPIGHQITILPSAVPNLSATSMQCWIISTSAWKDMTQRFCLACREQHRQTAVSAQSQPQTQCRNTRF